MLGYHDIVWVMVFLDVGSCDTVDGSEIRGWYSLTVNYLRRVSYIPGG